MTNNTLTIDRWAARLLVGLAGGAFILSYTGMYKLAVASGFDRLSFLWPLVTETAVVIFSFLYLVAKIKSYENKFLMPLIFACTGLSVAFNIAHAPHMDFQPDVITRAAWALPPLLLFASFKAWIWLIEQDTLRAGLVMNLTEMQHDLAQRQQNLASLERQIEQQRETLAQLKSEVSQTNRAANRGNVEEMNLVRRSKMQARRAEVLRLLQEKKDLTQRDLAQILGVTPDTIGRDLKALNGQVTS